MTKSEERDSGGFAEVFLFYFFEFSLGFMMIPT